MADKTMAEVIERMVTDRSCLPVLISRVIDRRCESEEDCGNIECLECREKWLGILADMIEREKAEAVSTAMERTMAEQMREWAVESGLPAFRDDEGFAQWLDRCFLPRPLFEDGEPVQFGDEIEHPDSGETCSVHSINVFENGYFAMSLHGCNASAIYEAGKCVKRPEQPVLDADGVPIEVGDTVYDESGKKFVVIAMCSLKYCVIAESEGKRGYHIMSYFLTHKEPDTQERIEMDALRTATNYWRCEGTLCNECPARVDGKTPAERYDTPDDCDLAMVLDLLRRQRELDARKGGD